MYVVLNSDGYLISQLHDSTPEELARCGAVEAPDAEDLTSSWRLVDGQWVAPPVVELPPGGITSSTV